MELLHKVRDQKWGSRQSKSDLPSFRTMSPNVPSVPYLVSLTYLMLIPNNKNRVHAWTRFAKFEEKLGELQNAREVYENAIDYMGELSNDEKLFIAFAKFEERAKEVHYFYFYLVIVTCSICFAQLLQ